MVVNSEETAADSLLNVMSILKLPLKHEDKDLVRLTTGCLSIQM